MLLSLLWELILEKESFFFSKQIEQYIRSFHDNFDTILCHPPPSFIVAT